MKTGYNFRRNSRWRSWPSAGSPHVGVGRFGQVPGTHLDIVKGIHTVRRDHQITRVAEKHRGGGIPKIQLSTLLPIEAQLRIPVNPNGMREPQWLAA